MTPSQLIDVLCRPLAALPRELAMVPLPGPFDVEIRPPGSKSLTNRALLLAALAEGESVITGALLDADDAMVMIEALRQLGAAIEFMDEPRAPARGSLRIRGAAGHLRGNCTLNLKNAGTATRFLTAAACLADGPVIIDGNERMRQRPIGELVAMLRQLGVTIDELGAPGCVPLRVHPCRPKGGLLKVGTTASSQFVSALMLIGPFMQERLTIKFTERPTSPSYLMLTMALMAHTLWDSAYDDPENLLYWWEILQPPPMIPKGFTLEIESDASGATYFLAAAAIRPCAQTRILGLTTGAMQPDALFILPLGRMGAPMGGDSAQHVYGAQGGLIGIHIDFNEMPDAAMTLAAVACFVKDGGVTTINGLRTLRVKETDRLTAMQTELSKLGVRIEIFQSGSPPPPLPAGERSESSRTEGARAAFDEGLRITPPPGGIDCSASAPCVVFDTYDDHRMAMSLALIGLRRPNVVIRDPQCVAKTYPTFWRHLSLLYQSAVEGGRHLSSERA